MSSISINEQKIELLRLIDQDRLSALFQPIVALGMGGIYGYEGLIRGPADSCLHAPLDLFTVAEQCGLLPDLDLACRRTIIRSFIKQDLAGRLFLNVTPACLASPSFRSGATLAFLEELGLSPRRVVIELTEIHPADNFQQLREALLHYRAMGFHIALDDLGEGFSGLRLWSELQPDYVKIDKYFVRGIGGDPQKRQFVRSIYHIALNTGARVIAEGVETQQELDAVRRIGIDLVQGYHLARPQTQPPRQLDCKLLNPLPQEHETSTHQTAQSLLIEISPVLADTSCQEIYDCFSRKADLYALPVVNQAGLPQGLLKRSEVLECYARPFNRELYHSRPCTALMDPAPLIVEHSISLEELSKVVTSSERRYLADGFLITKGGFYIGMGAGHDLMRAITDMQIRAARHANPLTLLPGNVPIQEKIQHLLSAGHDFVTVYADLDFFKPYNDIYGYDKGDQVITALSQVLQQVIDPICDFIGHIGGDDFLLLLRSDNWQARCEEVLKLFNARIHEFFSPEHLYAGGYQAADRQGNLCWHPLISLSLGVAPIKPAVYSSHHAVAHAAAQAKKMAKQQSGSSLFIERRQAPHDADPALNILLAKQA